MIERLTCSAHFPISRATVIGDFQPRTGITAVVGKNGAGKTFSTIETARWLLYGKPALRGAAPDYKTAEASGVFVIRCALYEISRGKHEWVKDSTGKTVAVGAEKVTEYLTQAMGYGLDVFDLCNAATQGNVQKLGEMRPAERKAMIDKVLRLTDAERAEKDCREEAKGHRREAETLTKTLIAPGDAPQPPAGYISSTSLRGALMAMRKIRDEHEALVARRVNLQEPTPPATDMPASVDVAALEQHERDRVALDARHALVRPCEAYTGEELDAAQLRLEHATETRRRGPKPTMPIGDVLAQKDIWDEIAFTSKINREQVTCPKCAHEFLTGRPVPPTPVTSLAELGRQENEHRAWATPLADPPAGPDLTAEQITLAREALLAPPLPPRLADRSEELAVARRAQAAWQVYVEAKASYDKQVEINAEIDREIEALGPVSPPSVLDSQADALNQAVAYEHAVQTHDAATSVWKETSAKIAEALRLAEEYTLGAKGIADARAVIKALIAPRISRIASALLADMTMGELRDVVVDEDMDITIGGQRIETLSGAGKTVANLALRVAMGQALVAHTFPVFLADEIDGDLDAERREATLMAIASLKKHLKQIILITHRGADIADQVHDVTR
jgi:hypothetical protein